VADLCDLPSADDVIAQDTHRGRSGTQFIRVRAVQDRLSRRTRSTQTLV